MLKYIYVLNGEKYNGYEDFCDRAGKCGIRVLKLAEADGRIDAILTGEYTKDNELAGKTMTDIKNDSLLITDTDMDGLHDMIVGLGERYCGNAPFVVTDFDISMDYIQLIYDRYHNKPHTIAITDRLVIREMTVEDLPEMYQLYDSLSHCPYLEPLYEYDRELEFTENYIRNMYGFFQYGLWLVYERNTGKLIGRAGLEHREIDGRTRQELGYIIHSQFQGKGYGYEACRAVLEYAEQEIGLSEIFVCMDKNNNPSRNLALKLGFESYATDVDGFDIYHIYLKLSH